MARIVVAERSAGPRIRRSAPGGEPPAARGPVRRFSPATPWLFLAPFLLFFGFFVVAPALFGLWVSLHDWDYTFPDKPFVGLKNYVELFTPGSRDFSHFWHSMGNTGTFVVISVPFLVAVPLLVALLLNRTFAGRTVFRAIFFAPYVLSVSVVGLLWRQLLDANSGAVNQLLSAVGLHLHIAWLQTMPAAWISLVGVTVWWTFGFNAIIFLAGLQGIPREHYEASAIDGANPWRQFLHITLPGLRPVLVFVFVTTVLASANLFGQSYIITQGGPGGGTETAIMYISATGLTSFRMGAAAAMSYILAVFLMVISVVNIRLLSGRRSGGRS